MQKINRQPTHPGTILRDFYIEPNEIKRDDLHLALDLSKKHLSNLLNAKVPVTPEVAVKLSRVFNTTPEYWLNLQRAVDVYEAELALKSWKPRKVLSQLAAAAHA